MRYLWVEDFDGENSYQNLTKRRWEHYFQISSPITFSNLEECLCYLDDLNNWYNFDVILIDIRFRVLKYDSDFDSEHELYKKYFSSFLTEDYFNKKCAQINNDPYSASAGILLYLALIYRYQYPINQIAFVSANIDETFGSLSRFADMKEVLYKAKLSDVNSDDIQEYNNSAQDIYEFFFDIMCVDAEKLHVDIKSEIISLPYIEDEQWSDKTIIEKAIDTLKETEIAIKKVYRDLSKNENSLSGQFTYPLNVEIKYNTIKEEFYKIGIIVPNAFEKPIDNDNQNTISWTFKNWILSISTEYLRLRSVLLPLCLQLTKYSNTYFTFNYMPKNDFLTIIRSLMLLFLNQKGINYEQFYFSFLRTLTIRFDKVYPNPYKQYPNEPAKEVLKLLRNWLAHIEKRNLELDVVSAVFSCALFVDVYVKREIPSDIKQLILSLIKEFSSQQDLSVDKQTMQDKLQIYRQKHQESYNQVKSKKSEKDLDKSNYKDHEGDDIYYIIQSLGHQYSLEKNNVTFNHLYLLYVSKKIDDNPTEIEGAIFKLLADKIDSEVL